LYYATSVSLFGQGDGALFSQAYSSSWQGQIFQDYRTGQLAIRGKNNGTWQSWRTVWDSSNDGSGSGLDADLWDGYNLSIRTNWSTNSAGNIVVGQLSWKNYGNNHTIFDASNSTSPDGTSVNNTNAQVAWTGTYPTLMGWNGANTYGVRVDSARTADTISGLGENTFLRRSIDTWNTTADGYQRFYFANAGRTYYKSNNGHEFRRNATDGATFTIDDSGNCTAVGNLNSNSDIKLKTNIKTLTNSLDKVLRMRGVEYDRIDLDGVHQIGVIAQEIEEIIPELVSDNNGTKTVSYGNIAALLIEAIKEQQELIEIQNEKIDSLEQIVKNKY
jgi:hypothetical protein